MAQFSRGPALRRLACDLQWIEAHQPIATFHPGLLTMHTAFSSLEAVSNPFAQMVDRGRVLAAVHRSERLKGLASHVFRPLAWEPEAVQGEKEAQDVEHDLD